MRAKVERWLARQWWRAELSLPARLLLPLAALYGGLAHRAAVADWRESQRQPPLPVPVWVVGNVVVGGAGKTPAVLALVQALRRAGVHPGIVSRGHGGSVSRGRTAHAVQLGDPALAVGDEALLLRRRAEVPVFVGRDRRAAAVALLAAHPDIDLLLSDDGLQHLRLPRALEIVVMDERGLGNGQLLPAGPLREPWPQRRSTPHAAPRVLLQGAAGAPGPHIVRRLGNAVPLAAWWQGRSDAAIGLDALRGRPLLALAGIATPEKFFAQLEAAGLQIERAPRADHARYERPPWPAGTIEVVTTEKDAVKLPAEWAADSTGTAAGPGRPRVWVLPLDSFVDDAWVAELLARHGPKGAPRAGPPEPSRTDLVSPPP